MGCPLPYANVLLAERFGGWPWDLDDAPLDRVLYYMDILTTEAETLAALEGLDKDEPLILEGDD